MRRKVQHIPLHQQMFSPTNNTINITFVGSCHCLSQCFARTGSTVSEVGDKLILNLLSICMCPFSAESRWVYKYRPTEDPHLDQLLINIQDGLSGLKPTLSSAYTGTNHTLHHEWFLLSPDSKCNVLWLPVRSLRWSWVEAASYSALCHQPYLLLRQTQASQTHSYFLCTVQYVPYCQHRFVKPHTL